MKKRGTDPSVPKTDILVEMAKKEGLPVEVMVLPEKYEDFSGIPIQSRSKLAEPNYTQSDMKRLSRQLRLGLHFSQFEWGRLLGVEEKSIARIEGTRGVFTTQFGKFVRLLSVCRVRDVDLIIDTLMAYDDSDYAHKIKQVFVDRIKRLALKAEATFDSTLLDVAKATKLDATQKKYHRIRLSPIKLRKEKK